MLKYFPTVFAKKKTAGGTENNALAAGSRGDVPIAPHDSKGRHALFRNFPTILSDYINAEIVLQYV
jgi:hypothetical protein